MSNIVSGKRKTSVAKLMMTPGNGKITVNFLPYTELPLFHRLAILEPVRIFEKEIGSMKYDFSIKTHGGGREGRIQASRLAIAKALLQISGSDVLKKAYVAYDRNIIVPDSRRKEARKPGDSKARAKRQKSYR